MSQKLLFGAEALHPGFPSSLVHVDIFCILLCSTGPASRFLRLCALQHAGRHTLLAQAWEGNGQLRRLGLEGAVPRAARVVLRQLRSAEAILEEKLCECSWQNNVWFFALTPHCYIA